MAGSRESGPYGCYGRKLSFDQRFQDIRRLPTIYAGVAGTGFFGLHVNSRALRWCINQARRKARCSQVIAEELHETLAGASVLNECQEASLL